MNGSYLATSGDDHSFKQTSRDRRSVLQPSRAPRRRLYTAAFLLAWSGIAGIRLAAQPGQSSHIAPSAFHGTTADLVFEHLNETNGLANPVATAFAEDGDGFLWVGTQSGLQRWDGYQFWSYKTKLGDPTSLPDNLVQALHADPQGRIWIGTNSGGVARYDRQQERFVRYPTGSKDPGHVTINAIADDGPHGLWIATDGGLDHLDTQTGKYQHAELTTGDSQHPEARRAISLAQAADGTLFVGTEMGLERSVRLVPGDASKCVFERVALPLSNTIVPTVFSLFRDHANRIWVGTQQGIYTLEQSATGDPTFTAYAVVGQGPEGALLATQQYMNIAETKEGEVWLGTTYDGVFAVTPLAAGAGPWPVRHISHDNSLPTTLSDDQMQALYFSHSGIMWLGTRRGVNFLDTTPRSVFTISGGHGHDGVLRDSDIYSVLARHDGSIWVGLSRQGIDILDATGTRTAEIRSQPVSTGSGEGNATLAYSAITGMTETDANTVYICTQKGLFRARTSSTAGPAAVPRLTHISLSKDEGEDVARVLLDQGILWIGGSSGLWTLEPDTGNGPPKRAELQRPLTDQHITAFLRGANDSLWVGTQNGLNRIDLRTRAVEPIFPDPADPSALGGGFVSSLLMDRKGRLWVGTFTGGIDILEGRDAQGRPRFHRIIDGLPNENIDTLLQGSDGRIWASTDAGLVVIDPDTFELQVLRHADGASIQAHWNNSGTVTPAGDLLFGGLGGLTVARPASIKPWMYQPPVLVTSARIGTVDVPISRFNSGLAEYPVWVPPDQNNLTVEFAALDYTAPELNRYEYKLEGFDRDWIAADPTRRIARYTNLPPGDYTLLLRGSNRAGVWAPTRKVHIRVLPTWYQKTWFRILVVILSLLSLGGLFLLATAYLRRQQRELERQVALRTAELEQRTIELKDSQQQLEHMAYTDSLTGLPNRRMFTEHFRRLLALKRRQQGVFALLLMDFDAFKGINDTYGHDAGDAVLKEMAHRMAALVRESDCLARLGGDEFGLLLGQSPNVEATGEVCRKVVESFEQPVLFNGHELITSPSIGIAMFPDDGDDQDSLLKMADIAMYHAKRRGGNGCHWSEREPSVA